MFRKITCMMHIYVWRSCVTCFIWFVLMVVCLSTVLIVIVAARVMSQQLFMAGWVKTICVYFGFDHVLLSSPLTFTTWVDCYVTCIACRVWVKKSPPEIFWHFFPNGWEFLVQILHAYYTFLSTLDYKFLFNYLQLWRSYAILSATTIMCSKCPPSTETHAGWSRLMWHNFVKVGDNWIKICVVA